MATRLVSVLACVALVGAATLWAADGGSAGSAVPREIANASLALHDVIGEVNVDGASLEKVIDYLRVESNTNIVVNWKVLEAAGITRDTPITMQVRNLPLGQMLRLALDLAAPSTELVYSIDSNVIEITTQDEADKHMITKVYVIADLLMQETKFTAPTLGLGQISQSSGGGGGNSPMTDTSANAGPDPNETPEKRAGDIITLIKTLIRPNIWHDAGGPASISYFNGKLIVIAPISVQEAIGGPISYKELRAAGL